MARRSTTKQKGLAYLEMDGNLMVPCSRYGKNTHQCAKVAWRLAYLVSQQNGNMITEADLDLAMKLVVNNDDDVSYIIRRYGHRHYT